MCSRRW